MDSATLNRLESLNQLALTESEKEKVMGWFDAMEKDIALLHEVNTDDVERMVHVIPMENVLREDVAKKIFTRDELQKDAPESEDGYWQVPRLLE